MQLGELFQRHGSGTVQAVADSGEPLPLTRYGKPCAAIVPHDWFERAAEALAEKEAREGVTSR